MRLPSIRLLLTFIFLLAGITILLLRLTGKVSPLQAGWYNDTWRFRQTLTIDKTNISGSSTLTDFPILVSLTDTKLKSVTNGGNVAQTDGGDIIFIDTNNSRLDHEIEKYDPVNGILVAWVRIPSLSYSADTTFYLYYGNPTCPDQWNTASVWDSHYVGVWHFSEGTGDTVADSKNGYHATLAAATHWTTSGKIGNAFSFDGGSDGAIVAAANNAAFNLSTFTVEAWAQPNNTDAWTSILYRGNGGTANIQFGRGDATTSLAFDFGDGSTWHTLEDTTALTNAAMNFYAATMDSSTDMQVLYKNGNIGTSNASQTGNPSDYGSTYNLGLGIYGDSSGGRFNGILDEIRLSNIARSRDWLKTEYNNQNAPGTFITSASEESQPNPLVFWKFDENIGTAAIDSIRQIPAVFGPGSSAPSWSPANQCLSDHCLSFAGSQYLSVGTTFGYLSTISLWIKPTAVGTSIISFNPTSYLSLNASGTVSAIGLSTPTIYVNGKISSTLTTGQWQHLLITTTSPAILSNFVLGKVATSSFTGFIDEVKIYPYVRTAAQIKTDYNSQSSSLPQGANVLLGHQNTGTTDPVVYWNFNENTGTTIFDVSNHNHPLIMAPGSSAPVWSPGKISSALKFDGVNDYAVSTSTIDLSAAQVITLEFWLNWDNFTNDDKMAVSSSPLWWNNSHGLGIIPNESTSGKFVAAVFNESTGGNTSEFTRPSAKAWHHYAFVINKLASAASVIIPYVDGVPVAYTKSLNASQTSSHFGNYNWYLMANGDPAYFGGGQIDDFQIYTYARTQNQIVQDMNANHPANSSHSLSNYWKFDENTPALAYDSGSQKNHLTLGTGTAAPSRSNSGKFGRSLSFDGSDYAYTSSPISLIGSNQITTSFWLNWTSYADNDQIALESSSNFNNNNGGILIDPNSSYPCAGQVQISYRNYGGDGYHIECFSRPSTGVWHHWAVVFDYSVALGDIRLFVDNREILSNSNPFNGGATGNFGNYTWYVMNRGGNNLFGVGQIDELKIYPFALSPTEISLDYNRNLAINLGGLSQSTGSTAAPHSSAQQYCVPGDPSPCSPPVSEWNFDENRGTTTYDVSSNQNVGTFTSSPSWISGKIGSALHFDSGQYVSAPYHSSLNPTSAITLSTWVRTTANDGTIIQRFADSAPWAGYALTLNPNYGTCTSNGYIGFWVGDDTNRYLCSTKAINDGRWHHLSGSYDGTTARLYIDGSLNASGARSNGLNETSKALYFGQANVGGPYQPLVGDIDQVRLYNYARTPAQIALDYNRGNPVAWYKLDECQGNIVYNSIAIGLTGTVSIGNGGTQASIGSCNIGTTTAWGIGASGKYNSSLSLDGVDDYVSLGSPDTLNILGPMSISLWVKSTDSAGRYFVKGSATYMFSIGLGSGVNSRVPAVFFGGSQFYDNNVTINDNLWHHLVATYDPSQSVAIYIDGLRRVYSTTSIPASLPSSAATVYLGGTDYYLAGQLDDVRVYNYPITATQVKTLFNENFAVRFAPQN